MREVERVEKGDTGQPISTQSRVVVLKYRLLAGIGDKAIRKCTPGDAGRGAPRWGRANDAG
jgi:hypothetical protein